MPDSPPPFVLLGTLIGSLQFGAPAISVVIAGAVIGAVAGRLIRGVAGAVGAVSGTLGRRMFRARLTSAFRRDRPDARIANAIAIIGLLVVEAAPA